MSTDRPVLLFACIHNSGRSVAAEVLARHHGGARVIVSSAGSEPGAGVNPVVAQVLAERGLPVERHTPTLLTPEGVQEADVVITMGCGETCPIFPGKRYEDWQIDDPKGQDLPTVRRIVDDVDSRVRALLDDLGVPVHPDPTSPGDPMTSTDFFRRGDITLDQQQALRAAATSLSDTFAGVFGTETIERYLHSSYDEYAGRASVVNFLPLIAERFARQRLRALARAEGKALSGVPTVLFLCVQNAGRSQMALGFFTRLAGDEAVAWSGGSEPGDRINPVAVAAMAERGIDITGEFPKPWTEEFLLASDVVITMGCGDACPVYPGKRYLDWDLDDPAGQDLAAVRVIRDDIERRVRALLDDLGVPAAP